MSKWVKNVSGALKNWLGQNVSDQDSHEIDNKDEINWRHSDDLNTDISAGDAKVSADGTNFLTDAALGSEFLQGIFSSSCILTIEKSKTITNATDPGIKGMICWDANYLYICVDTDTWKRVAISSW